MSNLVASLRTEAATALAFKGSGGAQWSKGMTIIAYKFNAAADEIERLTAELLGATAGGEQVTIEPLHASAPSGYKCSDCTIDGEACPACYRVWWEQKRPHVNLVEPLTSNSLVTRLRAVSDSVGLCAEAADELERLTAHSADKDRTIERLRQKSIDDELTLSEHRVIIERLTAELAEYKARAERAEITQVESSKRYGSPAALEAERDRLELLYNIQCEHSKRLRAVLEELRSYLNRADGDVAEIFKRIVDKALA